ncbi:MAG: M56 family metallopeptidase [Anaerolineae bacterium]
MLILACGGFSNLCSWMMAWCLAMASPRQIILVAILSTVFALSIIKQSWRTYRYTRQFLHITQAEFPRHFREMLTDLGINISAVVMLDTSVPFAFCFGFLRTRICLSTGLVTLLSTSQLRATLCHEDYHRRRFDPLRILLIEAVGTTLCLLPAVREWRSLAKVKLEIDADEYAIRIAGKPALAGALHSLLTHSLESQSLMKGTAVAGLSANTARIAALLGERANPERVSYRSLIVSIAILWVLCLIL